jgi:hypothetical protein
MSRIVEYPIEPEPLTRGPAHHFFGYYEKSPWDASGRYILANEVDFNDRMPKPADELRVGVIDTAGGNRFEPIGSTRAWCWQQGCMLQWLPPDYGPWLIYNRRSDERFIATRQHIATGERRGLAMPIYQLDPRGRYALSLNFARLAETRPGYGYEGVADPFAHEHHPAEDGVYRVDLETGAAELIFSLQQAVDLKPTDSMRGVKHWFNHVQINRDGSRFSVLHRWANPAGGWTTRLLTLNPDGSRPHVLCDTGMFSHYDWYGVDRIVGWGARPDGEGRCYLNLRDGEPAQAAELLLPDVLTNDGHNSFSPDLQWMLTDDSYSREGGQKLMLVRLADGTRFDMAAIDADHVADPPRRCDLHPRWNRAGTEVCFDAQVAGSRQMYRLDVRPIVRG